MLTVAKANAAGAGVKAAPPAPAPANAPAAQPGLPALDFGQVPTLTLAAVWSGDPAVVVKSPPGAGKSRLLAIVVSHLQVRAGLTVGVACQTTLQARDLAVRIAEVAPAATVTLVGSSSARVRPVGLPKGVNYAHKVPTTPEGIVVATSAKLLFQTRDEPPFDLLAIDEAWQLTYGDLLGIAQLGTQLLLVGDPGQIDPVVTGDTTRWAALADGPHVPAPDGLLHRHGKDVTVFTLPNTWRCGPATTALLQPLYDFPFGSCRPDRAVQVDGTDLPELGVWTVPSATSPTDPALIAAAEQRVRTLLAHGRYRDEHGELRPLTTADVAVVVANTVQVTALAARLADLPEIAVNTMNSHQGAEYVATVVVSPLAGNQAINAGFHLDLGRLCVGLSRHTGHATIVRDASEEQRLHTQRDQLPAGQVDTWLSVSDLLAPLDKAQL